MIEGKFLSTIDFEHLQNGLSKQVQKETNSITKFKTKYYISFNANIQSLGMVLFYPLVA